MVVLFRFKFFKKISLTYIESRISKKDCMQGEVEVPNSPIHWGRILHQLVLQPTHFTWGWYVRETVRFVALEDEIIISLRRRLQLASKIVLTILKQKILSSLPI